MERLERVVEAGGRLLKVERIGGAGERTAAGFLLTFDVGRLLVEVDPAAGRIHTIHLEPGEQPPGAAELASEDEPWWRLIGDPLTRVSPGEIGALGLRLQFRADHDNPRVVVVVPSGSEVQVSLEPISGSA